MKIEELYKNWKHIVQIKFPRECLKQCDNKQVSMENIDAKYWTGNDEFELSSGWYLNPILWTAIDVDGKY